MAALSQLDDKGATRFYPRQVVIGRSRRDSDALDRAVALALELFAAGIWDGRGLLMVNFPHSLYHQLHQLEIETYSRKCLTPIHAEAHCLRRGRDYVVRALSASRCRRLAAAEAGQAREGSPGTGGGLRLVQRGF